MLFSSKILEESTMLNECLQSFASSVSYTCQLLVSKRNSQRECVGYVVDGIHSTPYEAKCDTGSSLIWMVPEMLHLYQHFFLMKTQASETEFDPILLGTVTKCNLKGWIPGLLLIVQSSDKAHKEDNAFWNRNFHWQHI